MIKLERIVCPTDLSADSERTIRYAVAITRASGAKLFVCYRPARRLQEAVPAETHLLSNVKYAVQYGQPYAEILTYTQKNEIDLIAIGAHGTGFDVHPLFGSNVDRVLRQARCPLLIARPSKQHKT
jgi:nucleotide-binding universal stress UspA family protein